MKVCYLKNYLGHGGSSKLYLDIVKCTADENIEYTVCFLEGCDESVAEQFIKEGARVSGFNSSFKFDPFMILRLARLFRSEDFDVLHTHLPYAQTLGRVIGRLAGIKNIVSKQSSFPSNYHPVTRVLERVTRPLDSKTIAASLATQEAFTGRSNLYKPGDGTQWGTIHNGIDAHEFRAKVDDADPDHIREKWGIPDDSFIILSVGRYVQAKSQTDLIMAMEHILKDVPNAHLLLVGYGELKEELEKAVLDHNLSDSVTITGRSTSVHQYYAAADIFALSSIVEGFGIVVIEAMAAGLPVVGTHIPAIEEIVVENETGILVPTRSPEMIAKSVTSLLHSEEMRHTMGKEGFKRAIDKYGIETMVENYLMLYRELVKGYEK